MDKQQEFIQKIIDLVGGKENIISAENCMTRLRFRLKDQSKADREQLKALDGVMGVVEAEGACQVIVGPGRAKKLMDLIHQELGGEEASAEDSVSDAQEIGDWQANKQQIKGKQKEGKAKKFFQSIANIFIPLIPAIIAAGLFNGIAGLLTNLQEAGSIPADNNIWSLLIFFLSLMGGSFMTYFAIYVGINSAKVFGATPALGGMVGAMSIMTTINNIAMLVGLYDESNPMSSILKDGRGGILSVIFGVFILAQIEKFVRKHIPDVLDLIVTPTITIIVTSVLMVFVVMPLTGWVSDGLMVVLNFLIASSNPIISAISGYILAALFLPLVLVGMHQALIPIYAIQLEQLGSITLFPVLAMAGAGQVGTCIAIYIKARRMKKNNLTRTIAGALPAGLLGVGEPLLYGVTLPMGKPFLTGGLGAGFGGAYIMLTHVTSISWGTSGLPGVLLMTPESMLNYIIGLLIGMIGGFILGFIFVRDNDIEKV